MARLRVGCVGAGFIAERHLRVLAALPDVELVAIADAAPDRLTAATTRYGTRGYDDGLRLLAAEDLDAVWLCVPPFAHGPLELAAVERGLPFFVEKPLSVEVGTALEVAARVAETGLTTAVGYHWRYLDVVEQAAALLDGSPARLALGYWLDASPGVGWWPHRASSGGQVLEQTTHIFDLARHLVGEVDRVCAVEATTPRQAYPDADVPTVAAATLTFAAGAIGTVSSTCLLGWRHRVGLHLVTDEAVVEVVERSLADHELRVVRRGEERVVRSAQDPTAREDEDFLAVLRGEAAQVRVPYAEALRSHLLAAAADASAREGVPVSPAGLAAPATRA